MPVNISYQLLGFIIPIPLLATTWVAFNLFRKYYRPKTAYFLGFTFYWLAWCLSVPLVLMTSHEVASLLQFNASSFNRSKTINLVCLVIPLVFAYSYAFPKAL